MQMPEPRREVLDHAPHILQRLEAALPGGIITDPTETRAYECDALTAYRCPPLAVALPRTTEEVAAILRICHAEGVPVVPRGAGTSLAGGSASPVRSKRRDFSTRRTRRASWPAPSRATSP